MIIRPTIKSDQPTPPHISNSGKSVQPTPPHISNSGKSDQPTPPHINNSGGWVVCAYRTWIVTRLAVFIPIVTSTLTTPLSPSGIRVLS